MRRLTDEAVRLPNDLQSGKLENQADFILSECFREAATAFSMINQQLKRDGYAASIDLGRASLPTQVALREPSVVSSFSRAARL
jgi:SAM-dependent MidA family methyltransferase